MSRLGFLILIVGLLLNCQTASTQTHEATDVHLRNDCRLARQVLTTGEPHTKREWAFNTIDLCGESGALVLVQLWRETAVTAEQLGHLLAASARLRDQRLYDGVTTVVRESSRPPMVRAAGISLLGRWASPGLIVNFREFFTDRPSPDLVHSFISHDVQQSGTHPFPRDPGMEILSLLREMAVSEAQPQVRAAAERMAYLLSFRVQPVSQ